MKKYIGLATIFVLFSCTAKKALVAETNSNKELTSEKIIEKHYIDKMSFSTLYIKSSASYKDDKQSQNVTAEIKVKKDEKILISIRFFGITMAKVLITPDKVQYYEKINGSYFEGNYAALSQWLGTDLDFQKVQNMLIGEPFDDLKIGKYDTILEDKLYKLSTSSNAGINKTFYLGSDTFLVKKQEISQSAQGRKLRVSYPERKEASEAFLPLRIVIEAIQNSGKTNININYNSVSFNEDLSFPYSVPESYERVFIN
jgi:hypothetical protein